MRAEDVASVHGATRDWHPPPVTPAPTTNAVSVLCHGQRIALLQNNWAEKHCEIIINQLTIHKQWRDSAEIHKQWRDSAETKKKPQAMTSLCGTNTRFMCNGTTRYKETMHGQVFLQLNDNAASLKSDSNNTSGQSRLSPVAPVVDRCERRTQTKKRRCGPSCSRPSCAPVPATIAVSTACVTQKFQ